MKRDGSGRAGSGPRSEGRVRRRRRAALSAAAITAAAVRLADAEGLDAVSIRRLAAELDARPMSLYDHVADKRELLSLMAATVSGDAARRAPADDWGEDDWREALAAVARRTYGVVVAHPWLASVLAGGTTLEPEVDGQAERIVAAPAGLRLEPEEARLVAETLNDYVLGHALRADGERFEAGLRIVLDGIEPLVARTGAARG